MGSPRLNGYEIRGELGRGSMSTVYLARQAALGRDVAIKRLAGMWIDDEQLRHRFMVEGRALGQIHHPNIVAVYDLVLDDPELYLIMEYVDGPTLRQLLEVSDVSIASGLDVIGQVTDAIARVHDSGIVHRDIKPANILITRTGQCKLADFGIVKLFTETSDPSAGFRTRTGSLLGSPAYISPEAALGTRILDERADLYSLGIVAFELLVGSRPFGPKKDNLALLEAHISEPPGLPHKLKPGFPPPVEEVLLRALQKDPAARQGRVREFWNELVDASDSAWPSWRDEVDVAGLVSGLAPHPVDDGLTRGEPSEKTDYRTDKTVHRTDETVHGSDATVHRMSAPSRADDTATGSFADPDGTVVRAVQRSAQPPNSRTGTRNEVPSFAELQPPGEPWAQPEVPRRVDVQVFHPKRPRRTRWLVVAGACGVGIGLLAVLLWTRTTTSSAPSLAVRSVSLGVTPTSAIGHCPSATFTFSARVETNGGHGTLHFAWSRPDGVTTPTETLVVPSSAGSVVESLAFTYTGIGPGSGMAAFRVTSPDHVSSRPVVVRYVCP